MTEQGLRSNDSKKKSDASEMNSKKLEARRRIEELDEERRLRQELHDLL